MMRKNEVIIVNMYLLFEWYVCQASVIHIKEVLTILGDLPNDP